MKEKEYAVYKGDTFIDLGTLEYLENKLNLKRKTLLWYSYCKRWKKQAEVGNRFIVICLD